MERSCPGPARLGRTCFMSARAQHELDGQHHQANIPNIPTSIHACQTHHIGQHRPQRLQLPTRQNLHGNHRMLCSAHPHDQKRHIGTRTMDLQQTHWLQRQTLHHSHHILHWTPATYSWIPHRLHSTIPDPTTTRESPTQSMRTICHRPH